jgi:hypothetical protein
MNDKGIASTPAASNLLEITASQISPSPTVANENSGTLFVRETENSPALFKQRSRQKIIVQTLPLRNTQRKNHVKFTKKICELKIHANFGEF